MYSVRAEMLAAGSIPTPPTDNSKRYCERLQGVISKLNSNQISI